MLRSFFERWQNWTGDKHLTLAIRAELRRSGYAVNAAEIRQVRLAAIQRPGWVQVYRFLVETKLPTESLTDPTPVLLHGLSRNDGRSSQTEVLLTTDSAAWQQKLEEWSDGLIRRG